MTEDEITRLAAEREGTAIERERCAEKLADLEAGLINLKRLDKLRSMTTGKGSFSQRTVIQQFIAGCCHTY